MSETTSPYLSAVDYLRKIDTVRSPEGIMVDYKGNQITRKAYWTIIDYYKQYFKELGFFYGCGQPIAICSMNVPEFEFVYFAALELGLIASSSAVSFLASDVIKHTTEKEARTLVLSIEYCYDPKYEQFEVKEALKVLHEQEGNNRLERIIFISAGDYLPEDQEKAYKEGLDYEAIIKELELPSDIEIVYPGTIKKYSETTVLAPSQDNMTSLLSQDAVYSNTGGTTTGNPTCAVFKHQNVLNLLQAHEPEVYPGFPVKEGDRELLLIPFSHIGAQFFVLLLRRRAGACIVYNPSAFYTPEELIRCIISDDINSFLGTFTVYNMLARYDGLQEGCLSHLRVPCCGGEAIPPAPTAFINERLQWAGSVPMFTAGGSTAIGGGIITQYGMAEQHRRNQTGFFMPGATAEIINPKTGKVCAPGEEGLLYVNSPAAMDRFLNNTEATERFFSYTDDEGNVYGTDHDLAQVVGEKHPEDILGDRQDPRIFQMNSRPQDVVRYDEATNRYYPGITFGEDGLLTAVDLDECNKLYLLRNKMLDHAEVSAAEALVIPYSKGEKSGRLVCDVVLRDGEDAEAVLRKIYASFEPADKFVPEGILFLVNFQRNPSTSKREIVSLHNVREGYYRVNDEGNIQLATLPEYGDFVWTTVDTVEKRIAPLPASMKEIREAHRDFVLKGSYHQS
ncbi:MAG: acyl--CoA ligase [Defluviitaleaceae bacterium]|nr:acyl--CoA ligase [Defluviitaleaceae bacterium]